MPAPRTSIALGIIPMGRQSSAYGYSQALDGTWEEYQEDQRRRGAKRDRIDDATDFMGWYMDEHLRTRLAFRSPMPATSTWPITRGAPALPGDSYQAKPWLMDVARPWPSGPRCISSSLRAAACYGAHGTDRAPRGSAAAPLGLGADVEQDASADRTPCRQIAS